MNKIIKAGQAGASSAVSAEELAAINRYTLEPLEEEQVFTFAVNAADDQVDRDLERFSLAALEKLAELFVGKSIIFDHSWSAGNQTARVYAAQVVTDGNVHRLRVKAYMLSDEASRPIIDRIKGGILREVSVGCAVGKLTCSICGADYCDCGHSRGEVYGGKQCVVILDDALDAYELSFVAVPAQREAAVTKRKSAASALSDVEKQQRLELAEAKIRLREIFMRNL